MRVPAPEDACPPHGRGDELRCEARVTQIKTLVRKGHACHVTPEEVEQHRGPDGSLERESLEDGGLRVDRVRDPRPRRGEHDRHQADRPARHQHRPGPQGRPDPEAGRLPGRPADGDRARADQDADDPRRRVPRDRRRRARDREAVRGRLQEPPLAARPGARRPGHGRRAHRHGRVRHARHLEGRREADRPDHRCDRQDRRPPSRLLRRRGRLDQLGQGAERRVQLAAGEGRRAVGAADAAHPADRVRRARRGGDPAAARPLGRDGHPRASLDPEPPRPDGPERQRGRAARRARRRRRLLALLPQARARGAGRRRGAAGRARGRCRHVRPVGADLRPDRDGRDGRAAVRPATRRTSRSASRR